MHKVAPIYEHKRCIANRKKYSYLDKFVYLLCNLILISMKLVLNFFCHDKSLKQIINETIEICILLWNDLLLYIDMKKTNMSTKQRNYKNSTFTLKQNEMRSKNHITKKNICWCTKTNININNFWCLYKANTNNTETRKHRLFLRAPLNDDSHHNGLSHCCAQISTKAGKRVSTRTFVPI